MLYPLKIDYWLIKFYEIRENCGNLHFTYTHTLFCLRLISELHYLATIMTFSDTNDRQRHRMFIAVIMLDKVPLIGFKKFQYNKKFLGPPDTSILFT